jgi:D-alanyl-D-alanine carboxypeptidase
MKTLAIHLLSSSLLLFFFTGCSASDFSSPSPKTVISSADNKVSTGGEGFEAERPVHPFFDLDLEDLKALLQDQPPTVRRAVLERPEYFLELIRRAVALPEWALVLVDKEHNLPADYAPEDLVDLRDYDLHLNRDSLQLSRACMPAVLAMTEAARIDGIELVYSSTYRSYDYQKRLYENYVAKYGQEEADRFSAHPGTSQHQLGTAIDFGSITPEFEDTPAGKWLSQHAWEYGFSLSYPEGFEDVTGYMFEIWHYRYITATGTRLEGEFFGGIQQYLTEFLLRHGEYLRQALSKQE